jgi:trehalose synthase
MLRALGSHSTGYRLETLKGASVQEVTFPVDDPRRLAEVVAADRVESLLGDGERLRDALDGAAVVCVNSTASGGGVAEMLRVLLPYVRGMGIDTRWLVIEGDERFFALTKRLHNHLHGVEGDGGPLGEDEQRHYEAVLHRNAAQLANAVRPGDVVIIHDPQPAGLAGAMRQRGARVVWRCHVGTDTPNARTELGWNFLRPYLDPSVVDLYVFTRRTFAPPWVPSERIFEIPPSIDPFSPKNQELSADDSAAILTSVGLLSGAQRSAEYLRRDGSRRRIERGVDVVRTGPPPDHEVPLVVQVSRWDGLKDMAGVMRGFAEFVIADHETQLVLAGPVVSAVADDPEGAEVLRDCWDVWRRLPHHARSRIALACVPMADLEENAIIVNALQRHATVVVQKSLAEGFGLTVSEAMFKRRAVVASAVGGITDQIVDGESGVLLRDPTDVSAFARTLADLLDQPERLATLGKHAHERVVDRFLPDTQLRHWSEVVSAVLGRAE